MDTLNNTLNFVVIMVIATGVFHIAPGLFDSIPVALKQPQYYLTFSIIGVIAAFTIRELCNFSASRV